MSAAASTPLPAAQVGRWQIGHVPAGWIFHPGFGLWREAPSMAPPNICLTEDVLLAGRSLAPYVATQQTLLARRFPELAAVGPSAVSFAGSEEAMLLLLKHPPTHGRPPMLQAQTYVRVESWIGVATLTCAETEMAAVKPAYQGFLAGLRIG